jgi:ABC-type transport system involved in multi-copper enzyme maturation permease subunit
MKDQVAKSLVVARYTFHELLRSKILWNVLVLGLFIALATYVATELTYGVPQRVALDLGLASLSLSSYFIAILIGIGLIKKEEESRTIYLIISRPVHRISFLIGKLFGVSLFILLNLSLLSAVMIAVVLVLGGGADTLVYTSIIFSMLESVLLLTLVVLLSLISHQAIALMGSLLLLVVGHALGETGSIALVQATPWLKKVVSFLNYTLPNFYRFNLKDYVLYQQVIPLEQIFWVISYWLFYFLVLLISASLIISKKSMD